MAEKVDSNFGMIPFTLAVLAIPIFDTLRVMIMRIIRKKSPFSPDKTHLHHLFLDLGFSHIGTTIVEITSNLLVVAVWWLSYKAGASIDSQLYIVIGFGFSVTFGFYKFVRIQIKKDTKLLHFMMNFGRSSHIDHAPWFERFSKYLDND